DVMVETLRPAAVANLQDGVTEEANWHTVLHQRVDGPRRPRGRFRSGGGGRAPCAPTSDREAGPEHPTDQVRIGAEMVEVRDVSRFERRPLGRAEVVTDEVVVGEPLRRRVPAGERGQGLVEGVGGPDAGCTHTVAQPVIHSGTGSYARTSPFQPGTAPSSAIQLRIS